MTSRVLLLSLRPRFADAILSGTKTTELRRRPVNAGSGTRVVLYSSAPRMAIVGTARLREVEASEPDEAWQRHHRRLGLTKAEFADYLADSDLAYLLHLKDVCTLDRPLHLHELRRSGSFHPPQSFRYIAETDPELLQELITTL